MTRLLSQLLEATEPQFQQRLKQLEQLSGHPASDIRLSAELNSAVHEKLEQLGLDGNDTTGPELYAALEQKLQADETAFAQTLQLEAPSQSDISTKIARILTDQIQTKTAYALKPAVAKKLLKAQLPRKTMKLLGYRSAESMLRHESIPVLYAAACLAESPQWAKRMLTAYGKLKASDFEVRELTIEAPNSTRWHSLANSVVASSKQFVLGIKELGAVVLLPLPANQAERPKFVTLMAATLAIHAVNEVRAAGTFMRLHHMQKKFGAIVQQTVLHEPMLLTETLDQPVSWHNLHQFFARLGDVANADVFEPMVAAEELAWDGIEEILSRISPNLGFWRGTSHLGLLASGTSISLNLTDALLSHTNQLPFEQRVSQYFKQALQSEILLRYLKHDKLEQAVLGNVQAKLAPEMATINEYN